MLYHISALPSISLEGLISYTQLFRFIRLWVDVYEIPWHTEYLTSLSNYMLDGDTDKSINRIACKNISFVQYVALIESEKGKGLSLMLDGTILFIGKGIIVCSSTIKNSL